MVFPETLEDKFQSLSYTDEVLFRDKLSWADWLLQCNTNWTRTRLNCQFEGGQSEPQSIYWVVCNCNILSRTNPSQADWLSPRLKMTNAKQYVILSSMSFSCHPCDILWQRRHEAVTVIAWQIVIALGGSTGAQIIIIGAGICINLGTLAKMDKEADICDIPIKQYREIVYVTYLGPHTENNTSNTHRFSCHLFPLLQYFPPALQWNSPQHAQGGCFHYKQEVGNRKLEKTAILLSCVFMPFCACFMSDIICRRQGKRKNGTVGPEYNSLVENRSWWNALDRFLLLYSHIVPLQFDRQLHF